MGLKEEVVSIRRESLEKITTLIITAFGLVAALAWNTAIQKLFTVLFGAQTDLVAMLLYASFVTIIAVLVTVYLTRMAGKQNAK